MFDIIIIGAGPAGLTSALYALRAGKKVLVLEAKTYGGQIINAGNIANYPGIESISGFDYATSLYNQVKNLGCEIKYETVLRVEENLSVITNNSTYQGRAIIIATGADHKKLKLPKEEEFIGKGLSYCATCDGNFFKGQDVAVYGSNDVAIKDTYYLKDIVRKVYLINKNEQFDIDSLELETIKKSDNVEIIYNTEINEIIGRDKLETIEVKSKENNLTKIPITGLFIALGQDPKNDIFRNIVDLDKFGYIISDDVHTKTKHIYVAGDTRVKLLRQLTTAVGDGALAATYAIKEMED